MSDRIHKRDNKGSTVFAVIPAAGQGVRMGAGTNKQFFELRGLPVIMRTLQAFEQSPMIEGIIVAANPAEKQKIRELCSEYGISKLAGIADGGDARQDSVRSALEFLSDYIKTSSPHFKEEDCLVLIHDGARPFVSGSLIGRCVEGARENKACGACVPAKDTIKQAEPGGMKVLRTLPRDGLWAVQTPQSFPLPLIRELHIRAFQEKLSFTDDMSIAEHYGENVFIIMGEYKNIKITTPEDLLYAEAILNGGITEKT